MLKSMNLAAAGLLALLSAAPAAWALPYQGTLQLELAFSTPPPSVVFSGMGDGVSTSTSVEIGPGANITATTTVPISTISPGGMVTYPAFPIVNLVLSGPAGLTVANFSEGNAPDGGFGGNAGLAGKVKIGAFGPPPVAFLTVPLDAFGVEDATAMGSLLGVSLTAFGGGWTTGVARVIGTSGPFAGQVLGQATGDDRRTPGGVGTIVLVTPTLVRTNISGLQNLPLTGTLTLNFVPEPGTLMLLGSGIAGLAMLGRWRKPTA